MGYFANLYLIEVSKNGNLTEVKTTIYGGNIGGRAYFSWGEGDRPPNQLHGFAGNTIFTDTQLIQFNGYPLEEKYESSKPFLLDASFMPQDPNDPVVFHLILNNYIPMRNSTPFQQPSEPSIYKRENQLIITYPVVGKADLRFWVTQVKEGTSLDDFDITKLVQPEKARSGKFSFKFNLGIFEISREISD